MNFEATVDLHGKTATGLRVPDDVVTALGAGRRPKVLITIGRHTYRTTVFFMRGEYEVPMSAGNRAAAGVVVGEPIQVCIEVDDQPREVAIPADLQAALAAAPDAREIFERLSYTHRKEWVRWVEDAKREQTRQARVVGTVSSLRDGRRGR